MSVDSHLLFDPHARIAILGYGREGRSTLSWLLQRGVAPDRITIHDRAPTALPPDVHAVMGAEYLHGFHTYDIIVKSPGISPYRGGLIRHEERITSQTQIFMDLAPWPIVGVTGTKGKSTTATLISKSLHRAGQTVRLVGNIGAPVLSEIDFDKHYDTVVYELSSYMLHRLRHQLRVAILLDIYPDHLDWHEGFEAYRDAKLAILDGAQSAIIGSQVMGAGYIHPTPDGYIRADTDPIGSRDIRIAGLNGEYIYQNGSFFHNDKELFNDSCVHLLGDHNRANIAVVIAAIDALGVDPMHVREALEGFEGLPHRMQSVGTFRGIEFFDDAISTTPESTMEALSALRGRVGTILLGGEDRGYDFRALAHRLYEDSVANIVLFPESGHRIAPLLSSTHNTLETASMEDAVRWAYEHTPAGSVCLLSCASPSYSLWRDFEHKAEEFIKWIHIYGKAEEEE